MEDERREAEELAEAERLEAERLAREAEEEALRESNRSPSLEPETPILEKKPTLKVDI